MLERLKKKKKKKKGLLFRCIATYCKVCSNNLLFFKNIWVFVSQNFDSKFIFVRFEENPVVSLFAFAFGTCVILKQIKR